MNSKQLTWLLRHGAKETNLHMSTEGYAYIDEVCEALKINRVQLMEFVRTDNKQRFQVGNFGRSIRAVQGHSFNGTPVLMQSLEESWNQWTEKDCYDTYGWHGTSQKNVESILKNGLHPGARTHVHLAPVVNSKVGKRAKVDVLVQVNLGPLVAHGINVFQAPNGVILVRQVPPTCLRIEHPED